MSFVALEMPIGDRARSIGIIMAITFAWGVSRSGRRSSSAR